MVKENNTLAENINVGMIAWALTNVAVPLTES